MDKLIAIFSDVDNFFHKFLPVWEAELIADGVKKRRRKSKVSTSECITIVIAFYQYKRRARLKHISYAQVVTAYYLA
jgi:hypothetical protein